LEEIRCLSNHTHHFFQPDEPVTLSTAFNLTWQQLATSGLDLSTDEKIAQMKKKLALRILVSAQRAACETSRR
jgi:hypothetical protein